MKIKIRIKIKTILIGIIITMIGLGGIAYEVFDHIEILTIEYRQFPLSEERMAIEKPYDEVSEIKIDLHNYNVDFVPSETLDQIKVELISTDYMQRYIEPVVIEKNNAKLTIHSSHHIKLYRNDYSLPHDLLEFTKNHLLMVKYAVKAYNDELLDKNVIIPTFDRNYDFTETLRIYYPVNTTFTNLTVNANGNKVYLKGDELNDEDIKNLMATINEK